MDSFRRYICSFSENLKVDPNFGVGVAALGRILDTKQIGVSVIQLPSGTRSSIPHAESLEEEFGYVISGQPSLWINGLSYQLHPGHTFGFPAGTGVCHTIINDGDEPACILNIGERTKADNQWISPLSPERSAEAGKAWWTSWPTQKMGQHPGTSGSGIVAQDPNEVPEIFFTPSLTDRNSFSYKGDNETFGKGVRLSTLMQLKMIGIHHEILGTGERSSWPHAESLMEEFCFVLKGHPSIWINGHVLKAKPGDLVFFEPGTNLAHTVMNETSEPIEYLGFGPTSLSCPNNRIYYPLHPARNEECRARGDLWEERPETRLGPHNGRPS